MVQARVVRLEGAAPRPKEKKAATAAESTIKLAIRMNETINDVLRTMIRYRGDLSNMANEALNAVDLSEVKMISIEEKMVRDTTITIPRTLHKKLKKLADDRDSSMNVLVNTALAHWLAAKGELKLR
jgi:predicted CopG family antitoxin